MSLPFNRGFPRLTPSQAGQMLILELIPSSLDFISSQGLQDYMHHQKIHAFSVVWPCAKYTARTWFCSQEETAGYEGREQTGCRDDEASSPRSSKGRVKHEQKGRGVERLQRRCAGFVLEGEFTEMVSVK